MMITIMVNERNMDQMIQINPSSLEKKKRKNKKQKKFKKKNYATKPKEHNRSYKFKESDNFQW